MRLFVALELPEAWRAAALTLRLEWERGLDEEARRALRWVEPELLHLTLRFLGEFADTGVPQLQAALDAHVATLPLALTAHEVGTFGAPRRVRTLWLGVAGELERLAALAAEVERAVVEAGAAPEARTFAPHITLARVRERASERAREQVARAAQAVRAPPLEVRATEVVLVRSHLGSGPPRYEVLSRHPRQPAGAAGGLR
ncbi:MAG: RNA 2',3'-cyclic phosphodiesterase [Dehalococcoidia bacterium]|nr:RNA 2',3'-cyclic phosphodiesterase [Dehalococcoidia bacterium]